MTDHKELIAEGHHLGLSDDEATDYGDQYRRLIQRLTVALTDALEAAQPRQIDREALARVIAVAQNVPFTGPRQYRITDAILTHLAATPVEGEVEWDWAISAQQFGVAADAFYEAPTDPALNEQGNRRAALAAALASLGIVVTP